MLKRISNIRSLLIAAVLFTPFTTTQAALLDVSSLSIDYVEASISAGTFVNTGASSAIIPPAELLMGSYQNPIFSYSTSFTGGSFSGTVYTTGAFGAPTPSATVDTLAGNFSSVDLSSLRLSGVISYSGFPGGNASFDTELWPLVTTASSSFYNDLTGEFSLSWAFSEMVTYNTLVGSQAIATDFSVTISGDATVVPVPAALWLLLSGMLGLLGVMKKNK